MKKSRRKTKSCDRCVTSESAAIVSINIAINGKRLEAIAGAEIWPGMFVRRIDAQHVMPHVAQAEVTPRLIVVENPSLGNPVTTPYSLNDTIYMYHCLPGDVVYGLVSPSSPQIDAGGFVMCALDGRLLLASDYYAPPPDTTDRAIIGMAVGFPVMVDGLVYVATEVW